MNVCTSCPHFSRVYGGNIFGNVMRLLFLTIYRKLNICDCLTRKAFMKGDFGFSFTKHVILDEVQNFRDEDGDWLGKARRVVRQHANDSECESGSNSTDSPSVCERRGEVSDESESDEESNPDTDSDAELDPECNDSKREGYLWSFLDRNQINHRFKTGIPRFFPQSFRLTRVIRTSTEIFNYSKKRLSEEAAGCVEIGHDFDGEKVTFFRYPEEKQIDYLIKVLKELKREGYSKGDIAVLFGKQKSLQGDHYSALSKHFGLIVDAEGNDHDNIVLSTFRKYSGLDRPVVVAVDIIASLTEYSLPKASLYCVATRAMVKLVFLTKEKRGEKRRKTKAGNLPENIRKSRKC